MKKLAFLYILLYSGFCFSQQIFLTEVKNTHNNADKFLYALQKAPDSSAQYLGKIEVSGFSDEDAKVFSEIYQKAKSIGANTYVLQSPESIVEETLFNPARYFLKLYYTDVAKIPKGKPMVFLINTDKEISIRINKVKLKIPSRSFTAHDLSQNDETEIAAGNFLGSRIKLSYRIGQEEQYFRVTGKRISENHYEPGLSYKTGDFIRLEKSFAQFLLQIYGSQH